MGKATDEPKVVEDPNTAPTAVCTRSGCALLKEEHNNEEHLTVFPVDTLNEFVMMSGQNMPNHTTSQAGRGKFIKIGVPDSPVFRTKQQLYRFVAYAMAMAFVLPDEDGQHTYEEVEHAIRNV